MSDSLTAGKGKTPGNRMISWLTGWLRYLTFSYYVQKRQAPRRWKGYLKFAGRRVKINCADIDEVIAFLIKLKKESQRAKSPDNHSPDDSRDKRQYSGKPELPAKKQRR